MVGKSQQRNKTAWLMGHVMFVTYFIVGMLVILSTAIAHHRERVLGQEKDVTHVAESYVGDFHPLPYSEEDVFYMAQALYFEGALQPVHCQIQILTVIHTRMYSNKYPNTIREVVWQPYQFSFTKDGKHEKMPDITKRKEFERLARLVLGGYTRDTTEGALYYYNPKIVDWKFKSGYTYVNTCEDHDFYKEKATGDWS